MNSRVEEILRKQSYDFAILCGKSESEAIQAGEDKIKSVQKVAKSESKQKWVNLSTGKTHTPRTPY
jgi:hypothetical protein